MRWGVLLGVFLNVLLAGHSQAITLPIKLTQADMSATLTYTDGRADQTQVLGLQQLPWRWDRAFLRQRGVLHVQLQVPMDAQLIEQLQATDKGLGLTSLNMGNRYRLRVNGGQWSYVGWNETTTQFRNKPRWHLLATKDLRIGSNLIELDIKAEPASDAGLSTLELGSAEASLTMHTQRVTTRYSAALLVATLSAFVCFLSLTLGWFTREKFFWVAAAAEAAFFVRQIDWWIDYPPVETWVFNAGRSVLFACYTGLLCWISLLLVKKPAPYLSRVVQLYLYTAVPILVMGAFLGDYRVYQLGWNVISLVMIVACVARLSYFSWVGADATVYIYTAGAWLALLFGVYDYVLELLPTGFGQLRLGNYSLLVFNLGLGAVVVQRYLMANKALVQLKLAAKLQVEAATDRERQRMMQDIHDSVGSQLVALLGLVNSSAPREQIKTHTSDALDELRMAVDAIDKVDGDLAVVLATMRHRLQPRLDAAKVHLRWQVDTLPRFDKLTPRDIKHIQRILLEVFSNIIQHAKAKEVVLSARYDAAAKVCRITISDDGQGFDASATTGRGLSNIQSRAEMLGATLSITSNTPSGTSVNLGIAVH